MKSVVVWAGAFLKGPQGQAAVQDRTELVGKSLWGRTAKGVTWVWLPGHERWEPTSASHTLSESRELWMS